MIKSKRMFNLHPLVFFGGDEYTAVEMDGEIGVPGANVLPHIHFAHVAYMGLSEGAIEYDQALSKYLANILAARHFQAVQLGNKLIDRSQARSSLVSQ